MMIGIDKRSLGILIGALLFAVLIPFLIAGYWLHMLIMTLFMAYLCVAWNLSAGYSGQISFAHTLFLGGSAYTSTLMAIKLGISPWLGVTAGMALSFVIGVALGWLDFRFRLPHLSFALVSLAIMFIVIFAVESLDVLGGLHGLVVPVGNNPLHFQFMSKVPFYYIMLALFLGILVYTRFFIHSKIGLCCMAMRDNERSAEAAGVNLLKYKTLGLGISGMFTAMGGTFYAQYFGFIDPSSVLGAHLMILIILFVVVGGMGTFWGPVLGAFILTPLREVTTMISGSSYYANIDLIIYGILVILVILFLREGVWGGLQKLLGKMRKTREDH